MVCASTNVHVCSYINTLDLSQFGTQMQYPPQKVYKRDYVRAKNTNVLNHITPKFKFRAERIYGKNPQDFWLENDVDIEDSWI